MCKMMISPGNFFFVVKFSFFGLLGEGGGGEVKGKSIAQNENNNYICHVPYLWNSIVDNHDFGAPV